MKGYNEGQVASTTPSRRWAYGRPSIAESIRQRPYAPPCIEFGRRLWVTSPLHATAFVLSRTPPSVGVGRRAYVERFEGFESEVFQYHFEDRVGQHLASWRPLANFSSTPEMRPDLMECFHGYLSQYEAASGCRQIWSANACVHPWTQGGPRLMTNRPTWESWRAKAERIDLGPWIDALSARIHEESISEWGTLNIVP